MNEIGYTLKESADSITNKLNKQGLKAKTIKKDNKYYVIY